MARKNFVKGNIVIENAKLLFRNFEGRKGQYNVNGFRTFGVILPTELVDSLVKDGWNVKWLKPRDEDDLPTPWLEVRVRFPLGDSSAFRPKIVTFSEDKTIRVVHNEDTVKELDSAEFLTVNVAIRPYNWEVGEKSGVKAYLKTFYATIVEDEFERAYRESTGDSLPWDDDEEDV